MRTPGQTARPPSPRPETSRTARVCLLIPTHAIPPLSYHVPENLAERVHVGSAVVAPLSGHSRLGIVVEFREDEAEGRDLEPVSSAVGEISIPEDVVEVCRWTAEATAVPLATVLRAALPPGLNATRYQVFSSPPGWPWERGSFVGRATLRKVLGATGLKEAEMKGQVRLSPSLPRRREVEWAVMEDGPKPDLGRAHRQRAVFEALESLGRAHPVQELLSEADARRDALRQLVRRGAVRLERRPETAPVLETSGGKEDPRVSPFLRGGGRVVDLGGAWVWRVARAEWPEVVAAVALAASEGGEQTLVLSPEREGVERLARDLRRLLPPGLRVSAYHGAMGRYRGAIFEAAREGSVDVLVGTRSAALMPMARPGAICVVDEPNAAHRAESGFEGLPIHIREIALQRGEVEGSGVLFLSPVPSLRLYGRKGVIGELPPPAPKFWPSVRVVDMRGSGAVFSEPLLDECRRRVSGGRVGVMVGRVGRAATALCQRCGAPRTCPSCGLPLASLDGSLQCELCGGTEKEPARCEACGSRRAYSPGLTAERASKELAAALDEPVGLLTANAREREDARIIVGSPRYIHAAGWETVILPDVDTLLLASGMGAAERAFREIHGAAQSARRRLLAQTRTPGHPVLDAALGDDYPGFASAELPRLHSAGYPPYAHLVAVTFEGPEERVRGAIESGLLPALGAGIEASGLTPFSPPGGGTAWRLLLRSKDRSAVASAASRVARMAAGPGASGFRARVEIDPEEV